MNEYKVKEIENIIMEEVNKLRSYKVEPELQVQILRAILEAYKEFKNY